MSDATHKRRLTRTTLDRKRSPAGLRDKKRLLLLCCTSHHHLTTTMAMHHGPSLPTTAQPTRLPAATHRTI